MTEIDRCRSRKICSVELEWVSHQALIWRVLQVANEIDPPDFFAGSVGLAAV
jgi:hypothetical protein